MQIANVVQAVEQRNDIPPEAKGAAVEQATVAQQRAMFGGNENLVQAMSEARRQGAEEFKRSGDMNKAMEVTQRAGALMANNLRQAAKGQELAGNADAAAADYESFLTRWSDPKEFSRMMLTSGVPMAIAYASGVGGLSTAARLAVQMYGTTLSGAAIQKLYDGGPVDWNAQMVEGVTGPISANAEIAWTRDRLVGAARINLQGVSLATATIPIVNDVRGEIYFDDLWQLTTPPGQQITVGELNPGIAVTNGRVRFQLLPEERVSIERAEFDFALGTLAMSPTTITLGADETRFELTLSDVDATDLLRTLNVPDLTATGQIEGNFPLLLTRQSAFVQDGVLRATGEGGIISYTGRAGDSATGMSRIAFDALRSFRYNALSLTIDGDLNGDVISSIDFSGQNSGRPIDLTPIAAIPGVGRVTVSGVPFEFNVRITAPFRRLAQTAATITDPGPLIEQGREEETQEPVDPDTQSPR